MGYPACSIRNYLRIARKLLLATILRLDGSISAAWISAGCAVLLTCSILPAQTTKKSSATLQNVSTHSKLKKSRKSASSRHGQQKIDPVRAREIQEALIREHYLDGAASGTWDAKSESAMQRYQADNGWQSKVVPDSRALIKMGLGPDHEHLLNPESAMTAQPVALHGPTMLEQAPAETLPKK